MKIWLCFLMLIFLAMGTDATRGQERGKMNREIALPLEVEGWKLGEEEITYNPKTLFDYIDGAAELYLAYGFQNLAVRRFEKPKQPPIIVELYEMDSSEDAYGLFSFERQDEAVGIGQGSEFGGGLLRFWKGKYFVSLFADGEGSEVESAILRMGRAAADSILATGPEPTLVGLIPGKAFGLVDTSIRYLKSHVLLNQRFFIAHQNILNLNRETEAVLAQYLQGQRKSQFLLVRYPGRKEAGDAYQSFMKAYLPDAGRKDYSITEDRKWTMARQQNEFVLIVFGAATAADAEALLQATKERLSGGR
jgi:hypothetical protein